MSQKQPFFKANWFGWLLILLSALAYVGLAYFTPRSDFYQLLLLFAVAFATYFFLLKSTVKLKYLLAAAIGFRLIFLLSTPALSDDYFRFVWDGRLLLHGENPFEKLPSEYVKSTAEKQLPGIDQSLFEKLNSPEYFSVYPPVCQAVFYAAIAAFPDNLLGSVIVMRLFLLLAEAMSIWLLLRILQHFNLPKHSVLWFALNPLVITELIGNLHFEALMICFWLVAFWSLLLNKPWFSAIFLGLAVGVKLLPLVFLPFLIRPLGFKKAVLYGAISVTVFGLLFLPFLTADLVANIGSSVGLYFQKFEFNASIYYLLREMGFWLSGYNQIAVIGKILSVGSFLMIMFLALQKSNKNLLNLPENLLLALTFYLMLATTVHPWYVTTLIAFSVLTPWRYVVVWSAAILLSYAAYQTSAYQENLVLITLEYLLVFGFLIFEIWQRNTRPCLISGRVQAF